MRVLPITSNENFAVPTGHTLITSAVSGGSFTFYLDTMLQQYNGKVCLYLHPVFRIFHLPCYDGQGIAISESDIAQYEHRTTYSEILCTNWIFLSEKTSVILFDNENTLRQKYKLAEDAGIPYLAAKKEILQKIKTP